jgi:exopolyphosphatase/guanosine-5'-triphosphate,3'-diphosphate pyrophosphatase
VTRVGAVDLGTNSTRLLVADVAGGRVDEIVRRTEITRLGNGVDARRLLRPAATGRVRAVLDRYRAELDALAAGRTLAVGTSAIRDAANGEAFLAEVEAAYGFTVRLLSGDEEAELTLRGAGPLASGTLLVDIGGGSTELIGAGGRTSLDIGSVRLTERFLHSDPPAGAELAAAAEHVRAVLPPLEPAAAVGAAGTVEQLQVLAGDLTLAAVEQQLDRLAALPLAERRAVPGLVAARAPVIVAGALIVREVLRRYGLGRLDFSRRDLLDGVALGAAAEETCSRKRSSL